MRNILFPTKKASYISKDYQPEPEQELNDMDEILKQTNERLMVKKKKGPPYYRYTHENLID